MNIRPMKSPNLLLVPFHFSQLLTCTLPQLVHSKDVTCLQLNQPKFLTQSLVMILDSTHFEKYLQRI